MKESVKHICINCYHAKQCDDLTMQCRKNAPQPLIDPETRNVMAVWPPTAPDEHCGDWKKNTTPEDSAEFGPLQTLMEKVIMDWNAMAEARGFSHVSKIPSGKAGAMLIARVKEKDWLQDYPKALAKLAEIKWIKPTFRIARFRLFIEPDTARQLMDGEHDDHQLDRSISK